MASLALLLLAAAAAGLALAGPALPMPAAPAVNSTAAASDPYLDEARAECARSRGPVACIKYRALKYAFRASTAAAAGAPDLPLTAHVRLASAGPEAEAAAAAAPVFGGDAEPRVGDSELDKVFRFALRRIEALARSRALVLDLPAAALGRAHPDPFAPRLVDGEGRAVSEDSRGKRKKLALVLPLLLFFKLKAILVPILLGVLVIKKMLIVAAVLLPSLLSLVKVCKPASIHSTGYVHAGGWSSAPADSSADYSAYSYGAPSHYDVPRRHSPGQLAYRGYAPVAPVA